MVAIPYNLVLLYMSGTTSTEVILMRRRLHDGPDDSYVYLPHGPRNTPPTKTVVHATLAALQWVADRKGVGYGRFTLNLSPADQSRIQAEYEAFRRERRNELVARAHVEKTGTTETAIIITDKDS